MIVLTDLPLGLVEDAQQPRTQDLVQPQEHIPVVVGVEEVVGLVAVAAGAALGRRAAAAEQQLGTLPTARCRRAIGPLGGAAIFARLTVLLFFFLLLFLSIGELATARKEHVRQKVIDDLLDLVLVVLLNAGLPLDMVDDEAGSVLKDLAVLIGQGHVRTAGGWSGAALLGRLLLPLHGQAEDN